MINIMRASSRESINGDCINAAFHGYFREQALREEQTLQGVGIVIDDQFNFMLSHWHSSMLNGDSFLKTSSGYTIYGAFEQSLPVGLVGVHKDDLRMYLHRSSLKRGGVEWSKEAAVINQKANIFYVVEVSRKDDQETTLDPKSSNSESSRYDRVRVQWKIKIVERCPLKQDGSLAVASKLAKRYEKRLEYPKGQYTVRQQNLISLLSSTLGLSFHDPSFICPLTYLRKISVDHPKIVLQLWRERGEEEELMLVHLGSGRQGDKTLGITFSLTYDYVKSLGTYQQGKLNGLGLQYRKSGQSFVGVFKENILTKEYKHNQVGSKSICTFTIRQLAVQEHLKSLNYVHNSIYLPEVSSITGIAGKISKYVEAFEREYQKRNVNYNETPSSQSLSSQVMNIYKYIDFNRQRQEELGSSRWNMQERAQREKQVKKPGFIFNKSSNKSVDLSPKPTLKGRTPQRSQKSPLKNVRIVGKIYHETEKLLNRSPSRQLTRLKLSEEAYRQVGKY